MELTKILVQMFSRLELAGAQDFGAGHFGIIFKTKSAVERFLNNPVVTVLDQEVRFDYRGSQAKVMKVLPYPDDLPDEAFCRALGPYGQVHSCPKESVDFQACGRVFVGRVLRRTGQFLAWSQLDSQCSASVRLLGALHPVWLSWPLRGCMHDA